MNIIANVIMLDVCDGAVIAVVVVGCKIVFVLMFVEYFFVVYSSIFIHFNLFPYEHNCQCDVCDGAVIAVVVVECKFVFVLICCGIFYCSVLIYFHSFQLVPR